MHSRPLSPRRLLSAVAVIAVLAPAATAAAAPRYPDLRTLKPTDLRFDYTDVDPTASIRYEHVLRFSNTVWNAGEGNLHLIGTPGAGDDAVHQRISSDDGTSTDVWVATDFENNDGHNHFHFRNFAAYELYERDQYGGGNPRVGQKTSFCLMDTTYITGSNYASFGGCGLQSQGITAGWGDKYGSHLFAQWVPLGSSALGDGEYVLRSVADPDNLLYESADKSDAARESQSANEAAVPFTVRRGKIRVTKW